MLLQDGLDVHCRAACTSSGISSCVEKVSERHRQAKKEVKLLTRYTQRERVAVVRLCTRFVLGSIFKCYLCTYGCALGASEYNTEERRYLRRDVLLKGRKARLRRRRAAFTR